ATLRSRNRHDAFILRQYPRERDLRGRALVNGGDLLDRLEQRHVLAEVVDQKARVLAAPVLWQQRIETLDRAGEKAAPEWRISEKTDAELAASGQDVLFDIARPQRILGLERGDTMHFVRASDRLRAGLRQQQMPDLALLDQACHR